MAVDVETTRPAAELPPRARVLFELLLEEMDASAGDWTIVGIGHNGGLRRWRREQAGGADDLKQFARETATS